MFQIFPCEVADRTPNSVPGSCARCYSSTFLMKTENESAYPNVCIYDRGVLSPRAWKPLVNEKTDFENAKTNKMLVMILTIIKVKIITKRQNKYSNKNNEKNNKPDPLLRMRSRQKKRPAHAQPPRRRRRATATCLVPWFRV